MTTEDGGAGLTDGGIERSDGGEVRDSATPDAGTFTPLFYDGFEDYAEGATPAGGFSRTTATSEEAFGGAQSARVAIEPGDNGGFGQWGFCRAIDPAVTSGGEVWLRLYVRWPASFEFSAAPWMKFLRLHDAPAGGGNRGYNDLYVDNADGTSSVLRTIKEIHDVWSVYDGPALPRDTWERYEMYLFVDDVPVDEGGGARVRIWRDDELIFDRTDVPTIDAAGDSIDLFYVFSYWNNEMPPSNHCFVDELTVATHASPPPNRDAAGNVYIGDWAP